MYQATNALAQQVKMNRRQFLSSTLLAIPAVALVACSTGGKSSEATPSPTATPDTTVDSSVATSDPAPETTEPAPTVTTPVEPMVMTPEIAAWAEEHADHLDGFATALQELAAAAGAASVPGITEALAKANPLALSLAASGKDVLLATVLQGFAEYNEVAPATLEAAYAADVPTLLKNQGQLSVAIGKIQPLLVAVESSKTTTETTAP